MWQCLRKYPRHNINALNIFSVIMDLCKREGRERENREKGKSNVNKHDESSHSSDDIYAHIINIHM